MSKGTWFRETKTKVTVSLPLSLKKKIDRAGLPKSRLFRVACIKALDDNDSLQNFVVEKAKQTDILKEKLIGKEQSSRHLREFVICLQKSLKRNGLSTQGTD